MRRPTWILAAALAAFVVAPGVACTTTGTVHYGARAHVAPPDLVLIAPGVYVLAEHDDSIFYSDGWYWRYGGGVWYRSTTYRGGWVAYRSPPRAIVTIERPRGYAHYHRDRARVRDHRGKDHRRGEPHGSVRDRRHDPPPRSDRRDRRDHRR